MKFFSPIKGIKSYQNDLVKIVPVDYLAAEHALSNVPAVLFKVIELKTGLTVGHVDFRLGENDDLITYSGHLGYDVKPEFRCRGFAQDACYCLAKFARDRGMNSLWITCNPDNLPSNQVCLRIGAELVNSVIIPFGHELYRRGDREKNRYQWHLNDF